MSEATAKKLERMGIADARDAKTVDRQQRNARIGDHMIDLAHDLAERGAVMELLSTRDRLMTVIDTLFYPAARKIGDQTCSSSV